MAELKATKTRLALLQAVADGNVTQRYPLMPEPIYSELDRGPNAGLGGSRYLRVTTRIDDLERVGWVRLGKRAISSWSKSPRRWELTDAGRAVLAASKETAS
jgi:hypothetical protein